MRYLALLYPGNLCLGSTVSSLSYSGDKLLLRTLSIALLLFSYTFSYYALQSVFRSVGLLPLLIGILLFTSDLVVPPPGLPVDDTSFLRNAKKSPVRGHFHEEVTRATSVHSATT